MFDLLSFNIPHFSIFANQFPLFSRKIFKIFCSYPIFFPKKGGSGDFLREKSSEFADFEKVILSDFAFYP